MKRVFPAHIPRYIFILPGVLVFLLQGCSTSTAAPTKTTTEIRSPTRQFSTTLTPALKESPTRTYPFPTFDPSFVFKSSTKNEFDRPDTILFSSGPGYEVAMDLYKINPDGSDLECITCDTNQYLQGIGVISPHFTDPAWSPDGSMYAFIFFSDWKEFILIRDRKMDNDIIVISSEIKWYDSLSWSPDGKNIAFSEYNYDKQNNIVCYIKVNLQHPEVENKICLSPEKISELTAWEPSWSPDGKSIIFSGGDALVIPSGEPTDLYQWDLANQNVIQITETPEYEFLPKWSPDGSKFAFIQVKKVEKIYSLWIENADGTGKYQLGEDAKVFDFGWSPDGKKIVYTVKSPIENESCEVGCLTFTVLKILDLETGKTEVLSDGKEWNGYPSWRPSS